MIVLKFIRRAGYKTMVSSVHDVTIDDIINLVNNPKVIDINNYSSKDEMKASQELFYWGDMQDRNNAYISNNWGTRCAIVLDYDSGVTIEEFIEQYNGVFFFALYTSISHKEELHKFRVIIPTTNEYKITPILKDLILEKFPGVDKSTCDNRGFYVPGKINDMYKSHISYGPLFDLSVFDSQIKKIEKAQEYAELDRLALIATRSKINSDKKGSFQSYKTKALNNKITEINNISRNETGTRYITLRNFAYSMANATYPDNGSLLFEDYEIVNLVLDHTDDANIRKMLNNILTKR